MDYDSTTADVAQECLEASKHLFKCHFVESACAR